jgi:hypothetical protein
MRNIHSRGRKNSCMKNRNLQDAICRHDAQNVDLNCDLGNPFQLKNIKSLSSSCCRCVALMVRDKTHGPRFVQTLSGRFAPEPAILQPPCSAIAKSLRSTRGGLRGYHSFQPALRRPSSIGAYSTLQYSGGRRRTYMSKDDGELVCSVCSTACASPARPSWPSDAASHR